MRTTCIMNLKGGVAKTCTAIHMGAILSQEYGKQVLLIDADSQCNLTDFFEADSDVGSLYAAITQADPSVAVCTIQNTGLVGLDILAASDDLMELDLSQLRTGKVYPTVIRDMVAALAAKKRYDFVLIDCPPAFIATGAAALMAADDVLIPIKLDAFSLKGMKRIMKQISNMQRINPKLKVAGILPTMWYNSRHIRDAEAVLCDSILHVFRHIRRSPKVDEMTFSQKALTCPHSGSEIDYRRFVAEYMEGAV